MPLVVVKSGQLEMLNLLVLSLGVKVGLYKNDRDPSPTDTLVMYTEADFSGYAGLQNAVAWSPASWQSDRAVSMATPIGWSQNGGPTDNFVYGAFFLDSAGNFLWAERDPKAPVLVDPTHPIYTVTPVLTLTTEFV